MKKQEEKQMKFKDTEVVINFFMCNINTGIFLQSFENVLCHFEPTISWLLSTYCNRKKVVLSLGAPGKTVCVCVVCVYSTVCWDWGGREGVLGVGLHDAKYYYGL